MTKLNYATRRASGARMGTIASKDIQRRAIATGNARGSALTKDPGLELILCGKQLGDEGLKILCTALLDTTASGGVKVEELNLSDNELELSSLRYLGEVVAASPGLRDLDLSKNRIIVETEQDIEEWTAFLQLFRNCHSMRLLSFSGNPMGDRAYEVFLRVYASEDPLVIPKQETWNRVLDFEHGSPTNGQLDETVVSKLKDFKFDGNSNGIPMSKLQYDGSTSCSPDPSSSPGHFSSSAGSTGITILSDGNSILETPISAPSLHGIQLRGLRSIPYIVFTDAGVTDAAALWLSYIVERHPFPSDLMPHLPSIKDGPQLAVFKALEEIPICKGIIWAGNSAMTSFGTELLDMAEKCRAKELSDYDSDADDYFNELSMVRSGSDEGEALANMAPFKTRNRRSSTTTKSPTIMRAIRKDSGNYETSYRQELEKARFKIQSVVLRDPKTRRPELWQTVLRMMVVSRAIFFGYDDSIEYDTPSEGNEGSVEEREIITPEMCRPSLDAISDGVFRLVPPKIDTSSLPVANGFMPSPGLYSDAVRRNGGPLCQEDLNQMPSRSSRKLLQSNTAHPQGFGIALPPGFSNAPPSKSGITPPPGFEFENDCSIQYRRLSGPSEPEPKPLLPGGLPFGIWGRIIALAEDPKNLTSGTQRDKIFSYAQSKETLAKESEYMGKTVSVQIRKVLEQVDGLAYEI